MKPPSKPPKPRIYICSCLKNQELISKIIVAETIKTAKESFYTEYSIYPQEIFGPFKKLKEKIIVDDSKILKFSDNKPHKAIYNGWLVNAFLLQEPADHVFIIYLKRTDDKKTPFPKGITKIPITEVKFI